MSSLNLGQVKLVLEPCSAASPMGVDMVPGLMGDRRGNLLGKDDVNHSSGLEVWRWQRTEGRMREGRSKTSKRSLGTEPQPMEEEQELLTTESALQLQS